MCVGNLQWNHPTQQVANKPKAMVESMAYAIRNRVSCRPLSDPDGIKASDLPLSVFLPGQDDYDHLRERMEIIVQRMLQQLMDYFKDVPKDAVLDHVPHEFSEAAAFESTFVSTYCTYLPIVLIL